MPTSLRRRLSLVALCAIAVVPKLAAQSTEEFDSYKLRVSGYWVYATPTGSLEGSANTDIGAIDLTKDLHFNNYSTFFGKLDWKFTHKNHIYIVGSRLTSSRETVLSRTFTFQGQTFDAGLITQASLDSPAKASAISTTLSGEGEDTSVSGFRSTCSILRLQSKQLRR